MSEPFVGEIRMFAGTFAPRGWAFCDGQTIPVSQNQALFSLLGTTFGGDGRTTFALPDLRGRVPIHPGSGPGLTTRRAGEKGGEENSRLSVNQIPEHAHVMQGAGRAADASGPGDAVLATTGRGAGNGIYASRAPADAPMRRDAIGATGGNQAHNNMPPYLCVNFIIALTGVYPSRS